MSAGGFTPGEGGGGNGAGQPVGSVAYNTNLYKDKALQLQTLLDIIGIGSPNAQHSYAGSGMAQTYGGLLPAWLQTQGLDGGNVLDNMYGNIGNFAKKVTSPGGFGAIAGDARNALQQFQSNPNLTTSLDDSQIMGQLKNFNELAGLPQAGIIQQARGNAMDDAFSQFLSQLSGTWRNQGDAAAAGQRFLPFLNNTPQYKWALGK